MILAKAEIMVFIGGRWGSLAPFHSTHWYFVGHSFLQLQLSPSHRASPSCYFDTVRISVLIPFHARLRWTPSSSISMKDLCQVFQDAQDPHALTHHSLKMNAILPPKCLNQD